MPKVTKKELIAGLNVDLANEYAAVITYRTYASLVQGPWRQELRNFFAAEIPDELLHAQMLCDKIVALGGEPVLKAAEVKRAKNAKEMLANALADEKATLARYVARRKQAEALGEYGLVVELDNLIADETRHRDELQLMLARWE
ncbi:MAG: ferritin-like domain-containing protein [Thermoanaerobaculia bacterium]|nr:ferritin-like domain-containing protein [Thermoanaerobaculia bacterium]